MTDGVPLRLVGRDHVHVAGRAAFEAGRPAQPGEHLPPQVGGQARGTLEEAAEVDARVLHQMLADAAAVRHHVDAVRAQLVDRADAASHQQHRRMNARLPRR